MAIMAMESPKAIWEVAAGIIPGDVEPQYTRRFQVTATEWERDGLRLLIDRWHQAVAYASYLQIVTLEGRRTVNWIRIEFMWP